MNIDASAHCFGSLSSSVLRRFLHDDARSVSEQCHNTQPCQFGRDQDETDHQRQGFGIRGDEPRLSRVTLHCSLFAPTASQSLGSVSCFGSLRLRRSNHSLIAPSSIGGRGDARQADRGGLRIIRWARGNFRLKSKGQFRCVCRPMNCDRRIAFGGNSLARIFALRAPALVTADGCWRVR